LIFRPPAKPPGCEVATVATVLRISLIMPSIPLLLPLAFAFPSAGEWLEAIPIILSLILIEGLLSVDNALAIAAMANHLPDDQKRKALRWGIIGAYAFRGLAMACAAYIIANPWLKIIGAAYLVYLMCAHFTQAADKEDKDADGRTSLAAKGFWATVASIELMDLSLSVDNVVAAVAMSPKLWVVCLGVFTGILALRFVAGYCLKLLEKYPILEHTAFLLIGYVGGILVVELLTSVHVSAFEKFVGIMLITAATIFYARRPRLQQALRPAIRAFRWPMIAISAVVGGLIAVVTWPFKAAWRALRGTGTTA
jgi:tellurite resistance protein TerC